MFALPGTSIEAELERETTSTDTESKEVITNDLIEKDGVSFRYLVVKTVDNTYSYYSYIGFYSVDGITVKYYLVSTSPDEDLADTFAKFVKNTGNLSGSAEESQTEAEGGGE